jgi:hypothetical protein
MSEFRHQILLDAPIDRVRELVRDHIRHAQCGVRGFSMSTAISSFRSERVAGQA